VVALYLRRYRVGWSMVGWRRVNVLKAVGYLVGILVVFLVASNLLLDLVSVLVPSFNANQAQNNDFIGASGSHHSLALVALVLLPPVLEETIFRGFMFPALAKKWGVVWGAVISSAVFGLAHAQANISIYTFLLGLLLCFMYVRLRSIFPGMALHMLNNYLAFIALAHK
jgi:membrane protease YdiL (CAAX protease family)